MKRIFFMATILLTLIVFLTSCNPFLESLLPGVWFGGEGNIKLTINSDKSYTLESYSSSEDSWNIIMEGNNYSLTDNNMMKFDITSIKFFGDLETVQQPYSFSSTYIFGGGETLILTAHPLFVLAGYIYIGGNTETLIGEWVTNSELISTEEGETETGTYTSTLTINSDNTFTSKSVDNGEEEIKSGTYTIDTNNKELSLLFDGETEAEVLPYRSVTGGLLLGNAFSSQDSFESLIFTKETE
jgi:hypothetical protein